MNQGITPTACALVRYQGRKPYRLRDKIRPFCRGLLDGNALVEVAKEGLRRDGLAPEARKRYLARVLRRGSRRDAFEVLEGAALLNADVLYRENARVPNIAEDAQAQLAEKATRASRMAQMRPLPVNPWEIVPYFMEMSDRRVQKMAFRTPEGERAMKKVAQAASALVGGCLTILYPYYLLIAIEFRILQKIAGAGTAQNSRRACKLLESGNVTSEHAQAALARAVRMDEAPRLLESRSIPEKAARVLKDRAASEALDAMLDGTRMKPLELAE